MADKNYLPLKSAFTKNVRELPAIKKRYQVKFGYYFFSIIFFVLTLIGLLVVYDLKKTGAYFQGLELNPTVIAYYIAGLAVVTLGLRLRSSFCVICGLFRWPTRLDFSQYCDGCGAHLFRYHIYEAQPVEKSKHALSLNDRLLEVARRGDNEAIGNLVYKGAEINYRNKYGNTALMSAAIANRLETIDLLIKLGADPELKNNFGLTVLLIAVDKRQSAVVLQLLQHGVDTKVKTKDNRTAVDIAKHNQDDAMVKLLMAGTDIGPAHEPSLHQS